MISLKSFWDAISPGNHNLRAEPVPSSSSSFPSESQVVVIGSGLAGLTCAGVLASAGKQVTVLESHYHPGGAAHTFRAKAKGIKGDFCFDSGPSLYGGLSGERTSSPLKHVYQILGEEPEWIQYDRCQLAKHFVFNFLMHQ